MKQYITEEELKSLSIEQQVKLHKLVRGDIERRPFKHFEVTIGKMIELLGDHYEQFEIEKLQQSYGSAYQLRRRIEIQKVTQNYKPQKELCDALFEAVKAVL